MTTGNGRRTVSAAEFVGGRQLQKSLSLASGVGDDLLMDNSEMMPWEAPVKQKPVLLLTDAMGECIPRTDSIFQVIAKDRYSWDQMLNDVVAGKLNLSHKYTIIWTGAQQLDWALTQNVAAKVRSLSRAMLLKNSQMRICVSAVLPQPRDQHSSHSKIEGLNQQLKQAAVENGLIYLEADSVYLDENGDIVRPIVDNYEDGFHLNLHGAHRLRKFWVQQLSLPK